MHKGWSFVDVWPLPEESIVPLLVLWWCIPFTNLSAHPHTGILYQTDAAIAYRPISASQLITRGYGTPTHTPYQLGTTPISTTASNSLQPLTHLPSPHSGPYQYHLSQTTQHNSAYPQRHSAVPSAAAYSSILPSSVHMGTSPALTPGSATSSSYLTGQQLQRPTTMSYNVGYNSTISSTASFGTQQLAQQGSPGSEPLSSQTVFSAAPEPTGFVSSQLSQLQPPPQPQAQQPQPQQQQPQWNTTGFQ